MNPFVNFHKRSIELPEGCVDLIDTLRKQTSDPSESRESFYEGFQDIPRYLSRLLESKALSRQVLISCFVPVAAIVLEFGPFLMGHRPSGLSGLIFVDGNEPLLEQSVRIVFEEAGFCPFAEFGVGGGVEPMRFLRYGLPDGAPEAANLIRDVLRRGFGLSETARLCFSYMEWGGP